MLCVMWLQSYYPRNKKSKKEKKKKIKIKYKSSSVLWYYRLYYYLILSNSIAKLTNFAAIDIMTYLSRVREKAYLYIEWYKRTW